jgi:archaellin
MVLIMNDNKIVWVNGETKIQKYHECEFDNKDRIVIFSNKFDTNNPNLYFCIIIKNGSSRMLENKTKNNYYKKKKELGTHCMLASKDINYLKEKALLAYKKEIFEINQ